MDNIKYLVTTIILFPPMEKAQNLSLRGEQKS